MSSACTSILVGIASPVSGILLSSKTAKFPFLTMDYSPWSSKNLINQNRLKKFKQVEVDMKCMQTNFGGRGHSGFRYFAYFCLPSKRPKFPLVHGNQKIELPQKVMHVEVDMKCIQANFG